MGPNQALQRTAATGYALSGREVAAVAAAAELGCSASGNGLMRAVDVRNLIHFNTRMGMYIIRSDRSHIVSFLTGYECGAGGECRFTEVLSEHLAKRYRVERAAMGWPEQISRLAKRRSLDWMEVYLLVSSELVSAAVESQAAEPGAAADRCNGVGLPAVEVAVVAAAAELGCSAAGSFAPR